MMSRVITLLVVLLGVSSCSYINGIPTEGDLASTSLPEVPDQWAMAEQNVGPVEIGWIARIDDPVLVDLVEEALAYNRNIRAAAAAVEESRALLRQAGAALIPAVDVIAGAGREGVISVGSNSTFNLGLQLNWEIDVWGRVRASRQAAALGVYSAEADFIFSQYSLAAAVAQAYFLVIETGLQAEVANKSFETLRETNRIVQAQRELGAASALDTALSRSDLASARASLIEVQGAQRIANRALEVLLGRYPANELSARTSLPLSPPTAPAGLPSELLERRPDIIAAELAVASAFNNVTATKATRLPTFSLTSTLNGAATSIDDVFDPGNVVWQLLSNLVGPVIDGGLRQGRVLEATAEQTQAVEAYAQTALTAFQEVENSLDQNAVLAERVIYLREAAEQSNEAFRIAQLRYTEGETDLLDVLTIQSDVFSTESALVSVERELLDEWINLNLALGGAW